MPKSPLNFSLHGQNRHSLYGAIQFDDFVKIRLGAGKKTDDSFQTFYNDLLEKALPTMISGDRRREVDREIKIERGRERK